MDAVIYLTNLSRLCDYYTSREMCGNSCPVVDYCNSGNDITAEEARGSVAAVEMWSKGHPLVTNGEAAVGMMEKMNAPYIRCRKNEVGQVEMILDASWWDAEYKGGEK